MIEKRLVTNWVATTLAAGSGKPVGRGRAPADGQAPPYYLLYSVDTQVSGAPYTDLHEDGSFVYQITSVSGPDPTKPQSTATQDQLEWMADKARTVFLGRNPVTGQWLHPLAVPGYTCMARSLDVEWGAVPGGTSEQEAAIMTYVQRFRFNLTPA
ncbi:hypothetical protein SAM23877_p123 (plasmid) [Streptomyces ambofaciens ATCC 23877]|uniref:Uncharacterized protein n=1 Tax=Streptomyces ambofaciens (strain ATCC 23877 / 3486 / DSM 40053 / JCM 4204 / NBRC 12836 / NRRL B-2516) TaxID=278992 RepID=A0A0K2B6X0_STRA7|nr:hypothetical protein [Streptomyces ambofaciens]AKZ60832.1 hypothetical protein SAM23877_p123 [Streptomyces ambofaciens ATCC 23877]